MTVKPLQEREAAAWEKEQKTASLPVQQGFSTLFSGTQYVLRTSHQIRWKNSNWPTPTWKNKRWWWEPQERCPTTKQKFNWNVTQTGYHAEYILKDTHPRLKARSSVTVLKMLALRQKWNFVINLQSSALLSNLCRSIEAWALTSEQKQDRESCRGKLGLLILNSSPSIWGIFCFIFKWSEIEK